MTLAYLRGGLSTCSVVWGEFKYFSPKVYKHFDATVQKFSLELKNYGSYLLFQKLFTLAQPCFLRSASFALVCDFGFGVKMTISCVISSIFSDLTC